MIVTDGGRRGRPVIRKEKRRRHVPRFQRKANRRHRSEDLEDET